MAAPARSLFRPPPRRRIPEDVAGQLRDAILGGQLAAGSKLPPERELALRFSVNRTSVRAALKLLEAQGLLVVRQGDGAIVQPLMEASFDVLGAMLLRNDTIDVALLREFEEVLEPLLLEMAQLAIQRCTPAELDRLRALRAVLADASAARSTRAEAARGLLVALSDMSRNRVWQMLARRTSALLASPVLATVAERLGRDPSRYLPALDACLAAMDADDRAGAVEALQRFIHLIGGTQR